MTKSRTQAFTVFDVVYAAPSDISRRSHHTPPDRDDDPQLHALRDLKAELDAGISALNGQKSVLEKYSDSLGDGRIADMTTEKLDSFMDLYVARHAKIFENKTRLQREMKDVEDKIKIMRAKQIEEETEKRSAGVTVVLLAEEDGSVDLMLSYGTLAFPPFVVVD